MSYALFEERRLDPRTGRMLNANLEQYKIAGALDVPRIDIALIEELHGRTSTDARGIGEPATVPTAAAIANAVYNAIGVRLRELPLTPARVLAALAAKPPAPVSPPHRPEPAGPVPWSQDLEPSMNSFTWVEVTTAEQAVTQLGAARGGPSLLKAGGVDVLDRLKEGLETPQRLIVLRRVPKEHARRIAEVPAASLPGRSLACCRPVTRARRPRRATACASARW